MAKKIYLMLLICSLSVMTFGQSKKEKNEKKKQKKERINQLLKQEEEGALIYAKQSAFGIKLNTDGYGIFYEHGKYKTITTTNLWWLELGEHHSKKEERKSITSQQGQFIVVSPFIYGKINNFYNLKLGFGQQLLIGGKGNKNGVAVSAIYGGGISAALLKPYYISVEDPNTNELHEVKYSNSTDSLFRDPSYITGSPGFTKGLGEMKIVPGLNARLALRFDYGRYNEVLSAIETGINAEYYTQSVDIMLDSPHKNFYFNAYLAITFGKRK